MSDTDYYFAFGSNLHAGQMKNRCPSARFVTNAVLDGHALVFNRQGQRWPGMVASVVERDDDAVLGVIWEVSAADLQILDAIEDLTAYTRIRRAVQGMDGADYHCQLYQAIPKGDGLPSRAYVQRIIDGARQARLPEDYIRRLKRQPVA